MTEKGDYILWLPLWYPNRTEPYSGDFIQRHARAASAFRHIEVLAVIRDLSMPPGTVEEVTVHTESLFETIVYYNTSNGPFGLLNRLRSLLKYRSLIRKGSEKIFRSKGMPAALHTHIYGKNCHIALQLSRSCKIPLFYSEHQTGFLKVSPVSFHQWVLFDRFLLKKFLSAVTGASVVSDYLGKSVQAFYPSLTYEVIPNVVDEEVFSPLPVVSDGYKVRFIHISTLSYQKNFEGVISSFQKVLKVYSDFELRVFGPVTAQWQTKVKEAGLEGYIIFEGEQPHEKILPVLQSADALILYSRFETFGCVLIEALSCGTPVIVSDIEPMREIIQEREDSIMVEGECPEKLAKALLSFIKQPLKPDRVKLHKQISERFGMKRVGQMFENFYQHSI